MDETKIKKLTAKQRFMKIASVNKLKKKTITVIVAIITSVD